MVRYRITLWVEDQNEESAKQITLEIYEFLHARHINSDYAEPVKDPDVRQQVVYPSCPKCNSMVGSLEIQQRVDGKYEVVEYLCGDFTEPQIDGGPGGYRDGARMRFVCPHCQKTLFTDFEQASNFMLFRRV